jgi:hypothetical protein
MTRDDRDEMASVARDVLWNWTDEAADPDPDQRGWKQARLDGILLACERTGILSTEEIARWRALAGGGEPHVPLGADPDAATRWLDQLLEAVRPMTRDQDAERIQASNRFHGALGALAEAGVITDEERSRWHEREFSASAPWLPTESVEQLASGGGFYAIGVPARTPDEQRRTRLPDRSMSGSRVAVPYTGSQWLKDPSGRTGWRSSPCSRGTSARRSSSTLSGRHTVIPMAASPTSRRTTRWSTRWLRPCCLTTSAPPTRRRRSGPFAATAPGGPQILSARMS